MNTVIHNKEFTSDFDQSQEKKLQLQNCLKLLHYKHRLLTKLYVINVSTYFSSHLSLVSFLHICTQSSSAFTFE